MRSLRYFKLWHLLWWTHLLNLCAFILQKHIHKYKIYIIKLKNRAFHAISQIAQPAKMDQSAQLVTLIHILI